MNLHAIQHVQQSQYAFAVTNRELRLRVRAARGEVTAAHIVIGNKYTRETFERFPMTKIASDRLFDYFEYICITDDPRLGYYFELTDGQKTLAYAEDGFSEAFDSERFYLHIFQYPYINPIDVHKPPTWMQDAVFYQIFTERFCNGDTENDPPNCKAWGEKPGVFDMFGGDLDGVLQKLDYIANLGINAVYLTPIFTSDSNHKYDTNDYRQVDPHFGDLDTLKKVVKGAHDRGMRVVLDAVFNHCGTGFAPFQDVVAKGEASPYKDWFHIHSFPLVRYTDDELKSYFDRGEVPPTNYRSFGFGPSMPKFNTEHPEVRRYLFDTVLFWMRETGIDGWRLDVSDEVDHYFWRLFRDIVKNENPEAVIIGENWHDARPWLRGDEYDSVMNYAITTCCIDYFANGKLTAEQFAMDVNNCLMRNTVQVNRAMLNLLDSHDTHRFLTRCEGDVEKLKLAALFLFTFIGAPCTYYGTEIGMEGVHDPDCRRTFDWDETTWHTDLLEYYKSLIALRKQEVALRRGEIAITTIGSLCCIERSYESETLICLINNTDTAQTCPALTPVLANFPVGSIPPYSGGIFRK